MQKRSQEVSRLTEMAEAILRFRATGQSSQPIVIYQDGAGVHMTLQSFAGHLFTNQIITFVDIPIGGAHV